MPTCDELIAAYDHAVNIGAWDALRDIAETLRQQCPDHYALKFEGKPLPTPVQTGPIELPVVGKAIQNGTFHIVNAESGQALGIPENSAGANGTNVQLFAHDGSPETLWAIERIGDTEWNGSPFDPNLFRIRHVKTGRYLDADAVGRLKDGSAVLLWDKQTAAKNVVIPYPNPQQVWHLNHLGDRKYQVATLIDLLVAQSCRSLDAHRETLGRDGGRVQTWAPHHGENQKWQFHRPLARAPGPQLGAANASGDAIVATYSEKRRHAEAIHTALSGGLRYAYVDKGSWGFDVASLSVSTPIVGPIAAVYEAQRAHTSVFFRGADGRLRFAYVAGGEWRCDSESLGAIGGALAAAYSQERSHAEAFFAGPDGNLVHAWVDGEWRRQSSAFAPIGKVGGDVAAVYSPARKHTEVAWVRADGRLVYSFVEGGEWRHDANCFAAAGTVRDVAAVFSIARNHTEVFALSADGTLHFFYVTDGAWRHDGQSLGKARGGLSAVYSPERHHSELFFVGTDGFLTFAYVDGAWRLDDGSFRSAGRVKGGTASVYAPQRKHAEVFFAGEDRVLHYFYVESGAWRHSAL